jgi:hypothetical protein
MRRHFSSYFKSIPDFKATRLKLVTENNPAEILKLLDFVRENFGERI